MELLNCTEGLRNSTEVVWSPTKCDFDPCLVPVVFVLSLAPRRQMSCFLRVPLVVTIVPTSPVWLTDEAIHYCVLGGIPRTPIKLFGHLSEVDISYVFCPPVTSLQPSWRCETARYRTFRSCPGLWWK